MTTRTKPQVKKQLSPYLQLGKFRLSLLVLFSAAIGYGLATTSSDTVTFCIFMLATLLCSMGANGLNQWWERDKDKNMQRTRNRPIPAGKISPLTGFFITSLWLLSGLSLLYLFVNPLTASLALLTSLTYLLVYTPLKTKSCIAVLVGAIPGAIPPIMGWAAAANEITGQAWVLGCILYLWQIPHFMSLASMYRNDYESGGFHMLPDNPENEKATRSIILVFSIALLSISLLAPLVGLGALAFFLGAFLCGGLMVRHAVTLYKDYSHQSARVMFLGSILYLPATLSLLLFDHKVLPFLIAL